MDAKDLAAETSYRLFFAENPVPMWVFDAETFAFLDVNRAAIAHYGYAREEFLAMTIKDIRPPEDLPRLLALVASAPPRRESTSVRHRKKSGELVEVDIVGHLITFAGRSARVVMVTDVTERRVLEERLRQAEKMEAVGRLAGGIAHDFNNILTVITSTAGLLAESPGLGQGDRGDVAEIRRASARAAELTRQLLAYGRKQTLEPRVVELDALVVGAERMLRRLVPEDFTLETRLAGRGARVFADPSQLEQVLVNLVVNARDALRGGGTIAIETGFGPLPTDVAQANPDARAGVHARLAVADDGEGMPPDVAARAFEPFFTTKPKGRGTGLGLATVDGIVRQSGGAIAMTSAPGAGTTVRVFLPIATEAADEPTAPRASAAGGLETVLLVEDEAPVRAVASRILASHGYRVVAPGSPAEALALARERDARVDLLLTDVVMPGMSGSELAARLAESRPGLRVLLMSGYAAEEIGRRGELERGTRLLGKPFTPEALLAAVRAALDAAAPAT